MSDDLIEESALRFEGFNDEQIAQIKAAIPKAQAVVAAYQAHLGLIKQVEAQVNDLVPVANMILSVLKQRNSP